MDARRALEDAPGEESPAAPVAPYVASESPLVMVIVRARIITIVAA